MEIINWKNHITSDDKVLLGKPIIKGTRISVSLILELLAEGWSRKDLLDSYITLTDKDISAVFLYLNECIQQELYFSVPKKAA